MNRSAGSTMSSNNEKTDEGSMLPEIQNQAPAAGSKGSRFAFWKRSSKPMQAPQPQLSRTNSSDADEDGEPKAPTAKSSLGILNDKLTDEVPGKWKPAGAITLVLALSCRQSQLTDPQARSYCFRDPQITMNLSVCDILWNELRPRHSRLLILHR